MMKAVLLIPITFLMASLSFNCASTKVALVDEDLQFEPSKKVKILAKAPKFPFKIIAILESKGSIGQSHTDLLNNMRKKAKEIGADAIIPIQEGVERVNQGMFYNPYLGGYQTIGGGNKPILKGYAIIFSTKGKKRRRGDILPFSGGIAYNSFPVTLNGNGIGAWLGAKKLRIVGELFEFEIPDAFYGGDFENGFLKSGNRIGIDVFFTDNLKGPYFPIGVEKWNYNVSLIDSPINNDYEMMYLSIGVGYLFPITKNIYFDTKISFNASLAEETVVQVGNQEFITSTAAYNAFLGIGLNF